MDQSSNALTKKRHSLSSQQKSDLATCGKWCFIEDIDAIFWLSSITPPPKSASAITKLWLAMITSALSSSERAFWKGNSVSWHAVVTSVLITDNHLPNHVVDRLAKQLSLSASFWVKVAIHGLCAGNNIFVLPFEHAIRHYQIPAGGCQLFHSTMLSILRQYVKELPVSKVFYRGRSLFTSCSCRATLRLK